MNKYRNIEIRSEKPEEYKETEYVAMKAFWNLHGPGCDEHLLVRRLRQSDIYVPELSRIAVMEGKVVGAILYSRAELLYGDYRKEILTFGPLCVDPAAQDYGVGGLLLDTTVKLARDAGYEAIVIFGEPGYYPKHGFVTCDHLGITTMEGSNFDSFMGLELIPGALSELEKKYGCKGKFTEGSVFEEISESAADQMAEEFPRLLKMKLPCQWSYENASFQKDGYELADAVQYKPAFRNMFNLYAHELSAYNPWLATQVSRDGNYLSDVVESYFAEPNKKPYVILCDQKPAGMMVLSGYCAEDATQRDSFDVEEFFVTIPYRGENGIAGDIVQRIWRQIGLPCDLSILQGNQRAIHFWEKMIRLYGAAYTRADGGNGMWNYRIEL